MQNLFDLETMAEDVVVENLQAITLTGAIALTAVAFKPMPLPAEGLIEGCTAYYEATLMGARYGQAITCRYKLQIVPKEGSESEEQTKARVGFEMNAKMLGALLCLAEPETPANEMEALKLPPLRLVNPSGQPLGEEKPGIQQYRKSRLPAWMEKEH
jgi:hypothetical protein